MLHCTTIILLEIKIHFLICSCFRLKITVIDIKHQRITSVMLNITKTFKHKQQKSIFSLIAHMNTCFYKRYIFLPRLPSKSSISAILRCKNSFSSPIEIFHNMQWIWGKIPHVPPLYFMKRNLREAFHMTPTQTIYAPDKQH